MHTHKALVKMDKPKTRRFSTALPSVASLRSKFERPASPQPHTLFSKRPSFKLPSRKSFSFAKSPIAVNKEDEEDDDKLEAPSATPTALALPRKKSIFQQMFSGRRPSSVQRESMKRQSTADLPRTSSREVDEDVIMPTTPILAPVIAKEAPTILKVDVKVPVTPVQVPTTPKVNVEAPLTPVVTKEAPITPKADVQAPATPKIDVQVPVTPIIVVEAPATPKAVVEAPTTMKVDVQVPVTLVITQETPSKPTPVVTTIVRPAQRDVGTGLLLCSDGYSSTLDAMCQLQRDLASTPHPTFLDPTTCRSPGMLTFLSKCHAALAFVDSALVSQTVQYQLERAYELNKHIILFQQDQDIEADIDSLFVKLRIGTREEAHILRFISSPQAFERHTMLHDIQRLLSLDAFALPSSPPVPIAMMYKYLVTGYSPDICDRIACELVALGYPSIASREFRTTRANAMIVCLPSKFDNQNNDSFAQDLRQAVKSHMESGLPCVAVEAQFPHPTLDLLVRRDQNFIARLPFHADAHAILRACDISSNSAPNTLLRFQGDALELFREVACKSRRFCSETPTFEHCYSDLFRNAMRTRLICLTAPSGWGKTTFLAELCATLNPTCSTVSKRPPLPVDAEYMVAGMYFFSRAENKSSAAQCVKSISRQLLGRIPGFTLDPITAKEVVDDKASTIGALLDALVVQPCITLKKPPFGPRQRLVLVLDAVDECEDFENLQIALNGKWTQALPAWLLLVCSCAQKPAGLHNVQHVDMSAESHAEAFLLHRLQSQWQVPQALRAVEQLVLRSQGSLLWLAVVEPLVVTWCENGAQGDMHLPGDNLLHSAVAFVFEGFCDLHQRDVARVTQMYSLALCAPRCALPIEIFSFCQDSIPPLLLVEDQRIKPVHPLVVDALTQVCQVSLGEQDHALLAEALEQAYLQNVTRSYAAGHANYHARLAGMIEQAEEWFSGSFARLFESMQQCVKETGDVLRLAQDCENLGLDEHIVDVLRLSNQACAYDVREFVGQVIGRMDTSHALVSKAKAFARQEFAHLNLALPNPQFSGLVKVGGPLKRVIKHRSPVLAVVENNGYILTCAGAIGFVYNSTSARVAFLKGHAEDITCCTFGCAKSTIDGQMNFMAFTGSQDRTAKFWQGQFSCNATAQQNVLQCTKTFTGTHTQGITCVAFKGAANLANATICTGSQDNTICVWDFTLQAVKYVIKSHAQEVRSLQIVDTLLFSGSQDKTCRVWDFNTQSELGTFNGHTRDVSSIAVFQKERVYTGCFDSQVRCFDFVVKTLVFQVVAGAQRINALALNAQGNLLAASSYDGTARVLDALTGDLLLVLKGHTNDVCGVKFCSNQNQVVTCSLDCEVRVWSVSAERMDKQRRERAREHNDLVTCVSINENYAVSGSGDGITRVWDLRTGDMLVELNHSSSDEEAVTACCVSKDGALALTGDANGTLLLWDCLSGTVKHDLSGAHSDVLDTIQISDDNLYARSVACDDTEEFTWDLRAKRTVSPATRQISPFPALPKALLQEDNTHVNNGPRGKNSVGFTLDASTFQVQQAPGGRQTFGQMQESFYLWEWC